MQILCNSWRAHLAQYQVSKWQTVQVFSLLYFFCILFTRVLYKSSSCSAYCKRSSNFSLVYSDEACKGLPLGNSLESYLRMIGVSLVSVWWSQGRRIRNIHEDYIHYSQRINLLVSRRSHESHEKRIVTLAFAIRPQTLGKADKRGRSDALSVGLPLAPCFSPTGQRPKGSGGERVSWDLCEIQLFMQEYSSASALWWSTSARTDATKRVYVREHIRGCSPPNKKRYRCGSCPKRLQPFWTQRKSCKVFFAESQCRCIFFTTHPKKTKKVQNVWFAQDLHSLWLNHLWTSKMSVSKIAQDLHSFLHSSRETDWASAASDWGVEICRAMTCH